MKIYFNIISLFYAAELVASNQSFNYEKMQNFGLGKRVLHKSRRMMENGYEYPAPLPSTKPSDLSLAKSPYENLYQGTRRLKMDKRVFRRSFEYPPTDEGHRILCESLTNCTISHIAIETEEGIPIILRGGVGYQHFSIIVRAKPGDPLKGIIRVYCNKSPFEVDFNPDPNDSDMFAREVFQ